MFSSMFSSMFPRKPTSPSSKNKDDTIHIRSFADVVLAALRERNDDLAEAIQSETDEHKKLVDELQALRDELVDMTRLLDGYRMAMQEVSADLQRTLVKYARPQLSPSSSFEWTEESYL